jgi:hypothetical protein
MASHALIGFLLGVGAAAWVYARVMRTTGGNTKSALIVAGCSGVAAMVLVMILLGIFIKN